MFPDEITERVIDAAVKLNNPACHFVDAAKLYSFLNRRAGLAQKDIMSWFNLAQSTLSNLLRLLALDSTVLKEARTHGLSERHCRALLHVDGTEMQLYVMNVMLDTKVGSQRAEQLVKPLIGKKVADLGKVKYIELINNAFCDIGGYLDKERKSFIASIVREVNALRKLSLNLDRKVNVSGSIDNINSSIGFFTFFIGGAPVNRCRGGGDRNTALLLLRH